MARRAAQFKSDDQAFGVQIPARAMSHLLRVCRSEAPHETGGILVGTYSAALDCAIIDEVCFSPPDSQVGRYTFFRGIQGLRVRLAAAWTERHAYYLGEWHSHPYAQPIPSCTDNRQLVEISRAGEYHCPEPVLLVVGNRMTSVSDCKAFVYPRGRRRRELHLDGAEEVRR